MYIYFTSVRRVHEHKHNHNSHHMHESNSIRSQLTQNLIINVSNKGNEKKKEGSNKTKQNLEKKDEINKKELK